MYYRKIVNLRTQFWKLKFWQSNTLQRIILIVNYKHKYNIFRLKTINYPCVNQDLIFVPSGFMLRFYAIHADVGKGSYVSWVTPKTVTCISVHWISLALSFGIFFSPVILIAVHACKEEFLKIFLLYRQSCRFHVHCTSTLFHGNAYLVGKQSTKGFLDSRGTFRFLLIQHLIT